MAIKTVTFNGKKYPNAPELPELHEDPVAAQILTITPEVARAWLRYNYHNRNQRESGKRNYSSDMKTGSFALNGATIVFSRPLRENEDPNVPTGKPLLMDGQHRLESCAASGQPFVTYVAYGIDPAVRPTIDTGMNRSFSDTLALRGEKNTIVLGSVIKRAHAWTVLDDYHLTLKKGTSTHSQLDEFFDDHPELRRSAEIASRTRADFDLTTGQALRQSVIGLAHWLFMSVDEKLAPEFFARLGDGADLSASDPMTLLRRRLIRDLTQRSQVGTRRDLPNVPDWQQLCYYIRTWNARLVWLASPEDERANFPVFALLGKNDAERIPLIKDMAAAETTVQRNLRAREAAAEKAAESNSDKQKAA